MSSEDLQLLRNRIKDEYNKLFEVKDNVNNYLIHPVFNTLPPKKNYPDYYTIIRNPVSLNTLKKRIPHYIDIMEYVKDVAFLPWNAKTYNAKGSPIYNVANVLEKYLREESIPRLQTYYPQVTYPNLGPLPEEMMPVERKPVIKMTEKPVTLNQSPLQTKITIQEPTMKRTFTPLSSNSVTPQPKPINLSASQHHISSVSNAANIKKTYIRRGRPPIIDLPYVQRIKNVLKNLKKEMDSNGKNLMSIFDKKNLNNPSTDILTMDDIWRKIKTRKYKTFIQFQDDFNLMLLNFKRILPNHDIIDLIEKSFNVLVNYELSRPDKAYIPEGEFRLPLDEIVANNKTYVVGDWVLLKNPNDPSKPVVGQIFRIWSTSDNQKWLNACWYFRPEQTVHRVDRIFYKNEVMKTGQYRDHLIDDIIDKCYVIHFTRFQRGDPVLKDDVTGPLFVCEFRYNENDKVFNKIRTWKACLPEEIRGMEDDSIPVNGRKFFKYPSPIKNLLPPNASINDPIPDVHIGEPNAPPLVGAVYVRPKLTKDDLGEYSTSDECPRYIIRPNDAQEDGVIDYNTGTIIVSQNMTPQPSSAHMPVLHTKTSNVSGTNIPSMRYSSNNRSSSIVKPIKPNDIKARLGSTLSTTKLNQIIVNKEAPTNESLTLLLNDLSSKSNLTHVVVDSPGAYLAPLSIKINEKTVELADHSNQARYFNKEDLNVRKKNKIHEILWFRGSSVDVTERLINLGGEALQVPLNRWTLLANKRELPNLDYEEIEEEGVDSENDDEEDHYSEDSENEDESKNIPGPFVFGPRPSAKFMSYKLGQNKDFSL
ncbi:hypothetical protein KAFR_0A06240 [Kazachstania africana CBS 2517]|uniref:BAH domain-containing protein n=1 Tax=Kazachstania africana (strain ATCC 22294 / BCRC 22015 / CBS 2517 / CECT 1963 / NBRC 1671 / NRRL Y-8276) TaxID=1071382 RepID=H2ANV9_KAZAF|nr:hypothetical protein KAFR_0A06240 [Kazachstania africana CBS 2517]CCF56059.1 hypothetical protein KAFR_0A06240 [Kazachstania africana CBS 2517]